MLKQMIMYNKGLADRFVSDYKLPVPITFNKDYFFYYLSMLEKDYSAQTKYEKLCKLIEERFDGSPEKFLDKYYDIRENIIQSTIKRPSYVEFNTMDMSRFAVKDRPSDVSSKDVYNCGKNMHTFLSIDLKKANFQALKYVNPDIVFNAESYGDFIGHFTDLDYVKESKYTRQVIFGMMNPKRHITVEKYLINEIRKIFESHNGDMISSGLKLVSMNTDELLYEVSSLWSRLPTEYANGVAKEVRDRLGIEVSVKFFGIDAYNLCFARSGSVSKTFFNRWELEQDEKDEWTVESNKLVTVPLPFFPIVYKLYNGMEVTDMDRHFNYEGMDAILNEDFVVKKVEDFIP